MSPQDDTRRTTPRGNARCALLAASALAASAGGCASLDVRFEAVGYRDAVFHYGVTYVDAARHDLMGPDWRLDNFVLNEEGLPTGSKTSDDYVTILSFDLDGDGEDDFDRQLRLYDLRFEHRRDPGIVWLRTFPVSDRLSERALPSLADDYVQEVAGGNYFSVRLAGRHLVQDVRLATVVVEQGERQVDGTPAYDLTFDVANVDQLRLDPESRSSRVRIVLLRPPYSYPVRNRSQHATYTTLMVVGYANAPDYFDEHVDEFENFLARIDLIPGG